MQREEDLTGLKIFKNQLIQLKHVPKTAFINLVVSTIQLQYRNTKNPLLNLLVSKYLKCITFLTPKSDTIFYRTLNMNKPKQQSLNSLPIKSHRTKIYNYKLQLEN